MKAGGQVSMPAAQPPQRQLSISLQGDTCVLFELLLYQSLRQLAQ